MEEEWLERMEENRAGRRIQEKNEKRKMRERKSKGLEISGDYNGGRKMKEVLGGRKQRREVR